MKPSLSLSRPVLIFFLAMGVTSAAILWRVCAQDKPPSAQEVLEKFIQVTGGKPAYEKVQNQVIMGTVEFVEAGFKGATAEYRSVPNKVYRVVELAGVGKIEAGTDGRVAWERSSETGPRVKTGEEGAAALREANFNASLRWRDLYIKVELAGEENVDKQLCYKIVLTPKDGKPITQYYDEKSGLLVKIAMVSLTPTMGEVATETYLGDYRTIEGIQVPHLVRRQVLSQQIVTHIESVRFNAEIPKDRFDLPADVQALIVKK
jgi:hypothetical protein